MKPSNSGRQREALAVHARPLVGLLLACALGAAVAEPVVNPALAPLDMSKLLQAPYGGMGAGDTSGSVLRRSDYSLVPGIAFVPGSVPNWNAGAEVAPVEGAVELKPRRPAPPQLSSSAHDVRPSSVSTQGPSALASQEDFDLLKEALRELHDTSEVRDLKDLWRDVNAEANKFRGEFLFEAPSEEELAQRRSARQREEGSLSGGPSHGSAGYGSSNDPLNRPRSAAEKERDSMLASVMLKKMLEEITPWAIGLVLSLVLGRAALSFWRLQAKHSQQTRAAGSPSRRRSSRRQTT